MAVRSGLRSSIRRSRAPSSGGLLATALGAVVVASLGIAGCGSEDPWFESVLALEDTYDTVGPYRIEAWVRAPRGVRLLAARIADRPDAELFSEVAFEHAEGDVRRGRWVADLPGLPAGSAYWYYLALTDQNEQKAFFPAAIEDESEPRERLVFRILGSP